MHGRHYFSPQQNGAKNHWIAWQCTFKGIMIDHERLNPLVRWRSLTLLSPHREWKAKVFFYKKDEFCVFSLSPSWYASYSWFRGEHRSVCVETITTNKSPLHSCSAPKQILLPTFTALSSSHHLEQICCHYSQQRHPFSMWHFKLFWPITVCTCVI